jgi:hypothetical protein
MGPKTQWAEDYRIGPTGKLEDLISLELIPELLKNLKIRSLFSIRMTRGQQPTLVYRSQNRPF